MHLCICSSNGNICTYVYECRRNYESHVVCMMNKASDGWRSAKKSSIWQIKPAVQRTDAAKKLQFKMVELSK